MAGAKPVACLEAESPRSRVRVEFHQRDNLFTHSISVMWKDRVIEFARAVDEVDGQPLANSPCFSQLHQQGDTLMLTGANGPCHWSMSVQVGQVQTDRDAQEASNDLFFDFGTRFGLNAVDNPLLPNVPMLQFLYFDLACRVKAPVDLASEYSISPDFEGPASSRSDETLLFHSKERRLPILSVGMNPFAKAVFIPEPRCTCVAGDPQQLQIKSADPLADKYPATLQWSYAVWAV